MPAKKPGPALEFWREVDARRKSLPLAGLAKKLRVPKNTLYSWRERGSFNSYYIAALLDILKWDVGPRVALRSCKNVFHREPVAKAPAAQAFGDRLRKIGKSYADLALNMEAYSVHSHELIKTLGKDSLFVFASSTTIPYEFMDREYADYEEPLGGSPQQGREIGHAIARAMLKGTLFLYIRPDRERVEYYKKWRFTELVSYEEAVDQIEHFRSRVKAWYMEGVIGAPMSEAEADEVLSDRLQQCYVGDSPMWMPGVGLSMAGKLYGKELTRAMAISLPGGAFGGVLMYPHYPLLEHRFTEFVTHVVGGICNLMRDGRREVWLSDLDLRIEVNTDNSYYSERFYIEIYQILRSIARTEPSKV